MTRDTPDKLMGVLYLNYKQIKINRSSALKSLSR